MPSSSVDAVALLKACTKKKDLQEGTRLHVGILKSGLLKNPYVASTLINMYSKCGALAQAVQVLEKLPVRDLVSWSALIAGYVLHGQAEDALYCFECMQNEGLSPDAVTFISVLKACASTARVDKGKQIHDQIMREDLLGKDLLLDTALVDMYAKCGSLARAAQVLEALPARSVVTWNALIDGYAQQGQGKEALDCFKQMQNDGFFPDPVTFISVLKACSSIGGHDMGEEIHKEIARQGLLVKDIILGTTLVDFYAKSGMLAHAIGILNELPFRNVVSWNALIAGYAEQAQGEKALACFKWMQHEGISPNTVTFISVLKACGSIQEAISGKQIHRDIVRFGSLGPDLGLSTALVDMYVKCCALNDAVKVHNELPVRNVFSWSSLISGYAEQGQALEALDCYKQMLHEGLSPNAITFTYVLKAYADFGASEKVKEIHKEIARKRLIQKDTVLGNALLAAYAKCGKLVEAARTLNELPVQSIVSWSILISGYVEHGQAEDALKCFERMQCEGLPPDAVTFICTLKACGSIGAADVGRHVHVEILRQGLLGKGVVLGTALVDMYAKCGVLVNAAQVHDELPIRNVVCWSALIAGYAHQGQGEEALKCFRQMEYEGLSPNAVTLACVLSACSHSGLLDNGQTYFTNMNKSYGITPDREHSSYLVDLFARAGDFGRAMGVIRKLPSFDHFPIWASILGACRECQNAELGRLAFNTAVCIDRNGAAAYVFMSKIYATVACHGAMGEQASLLEIDL